MLQKSIISMLLVLPLLSLGAVCCQHVQRPIATQEEISSVAGEEGKPKRQDKTLRDAYNLIFDKYVTSLTAIELVERAAKGIQSRVGTDGLSFIKTSDALAVSSSGETIQLDEITDKRGGERALIQLYRFAVRTNPVFDPAKIAFAAIKGMAELDSHSTLIPPDTLKRMQEYTKGRDESIGASTLFRNGVLTVASLLDNSPAVRAGILPGDQIILIDGEPTKDLGARESDMRLFGPKGTNVTITIMRKGFAAPREVTIVRDITPVINVHYGLVEKYYGHIQACQFQERTNQDFEKAIRSLEEMCTEGLRGLILDLRGNPGGLLDEATKLADRFIESGLIVSLEGRKESDRMRFYAHKKAIPFSYPMVLLVDQLTAAGSELVAGALQEHRRALILGVETFGNRTIQTFFFLRDGSALRLTTHQWKTSLGSKTEEGGIIPDVLVIGKKEGKHIDSSPPDRPIIRIEDTEEDGVLRIALEVLTKTTSNRFQDLMGAAREVKELEQQESSDIQRKR